MKKIFTLLFMLCLLLIPTSALAKGPFTYITVNGLGLTEELTVTNPGLMDFFTFANFSQGSIDAPANPGDGYEITRVFVDTTTNQSQYWDHLHYYPDTGYVYYDGLLNGSSEYDGKWYQARPEAEAPFRNALKQTASLTWISLAVLIVILVIFFIAYSKRPNRQSQILNQKS